MLMFISLLYKSEIQCAVLSVKENYNENFHLDNRFDYNAEFNITSGCRHKVNNPLLCLPAVKLIHVKVQSHVLISLVSSLV